MICAYCGRDGCPTMGTPPLETIHNSDSSSPIKSSTVLTEAGDDCLRYAREQKKTDSSDWQSMYRSADARAGKAEAALESAKTAIEKIKFPKHRGGCYYWDQCLCGAAAQDAAINAARSAVGLEVQQ